MTSLKLSRNHVGVSWGFRIHGGKDFNQPLVVLKVTANTIASASGLSPGDVLLKINNVDTATLTHKAAQDLIKNSNNVVEFLVIKASSDTMSTWQPMVTPLGQPTGDQVWTKTSLKKQGQGHQNGQGGQINSRAKPFSSGKLVNRQFNSPIGIYSDSAIAETLSAQSEVLQGGAIGVNFKKNEKKYNYENSEVYKMLQQENESNENNEQTINSPAMSRIVQQSSPGQQQQQSPKIGTGFTVPAVQLKPVQAAATAPVTAVSAPVNNNQGLSPGANICADCERLIVGVFVRIKDKNLHVDCFKCATCGQSLKNVGYYNLNNKLYCDIHAKLVAKGAHPGLVAGGFSPVTQTPTQKPFNYTAQQPNYQPISPFNAPAPFQPLSMPTSGAIHHVTAPKSPQQQQIQSFSQQQSFESFEKTEKIHSSGGSSFDNKVIWPPVGVDLPSAPGSVGSSGVQQKFVPKHVPYQPLNSLLMQQPLINKQNFAPQQNYSAPPQQQNYSAPPASAPKNPRSASAVSSSTIANRIGRGILNQPGARVAVCGVCNRQIRGPFISTSSKFYCPAHFNCGSCSRDLMEVGFVDLGQLHCEFCWERELAPICGKCGRRIKYECLKAVGREWHSECFTCSKCSKKFGKEPFFVEDGQAFCQADWNELFTTKCFACHFAIEAGDRWVEALNNSYHSQCFNCSACKTNLEGKSFFAKQGRAYCKAHARC